MGIDESEAKYVFQSIALSCVFHSLTYKLTSSTYLKDYPIKMDKKDINEGQRSTRSNYRGDIVLQGKNDLCHTSFLYDASKNWNNAPNVIKESTSLYKAKKEIKKHVSTLPF